MVAHYFPGNLRNAMITPVIIEPKANTIRKYNMSTIFHPTCSPVRFCGSSIFPISDKITTAVINPTADITPTNIKIIFIKSFPLLIFFHLLYLLESATLKLVAGKFLNSCQNIGCDRCEGKKPFIVRLLCGIFPFISHLLLRLRRLLYRLQVVLQLLYHRLQYQQSQYYQTSFHFFLSQSKEISLKQYFPSFYHLLDHICIYPTLTKKKKLQTASPQFGNVTFPMTFLNNLYDINFIYIVFSVYFFIYGRCCLKYDFFKQLSFFIGNISLRFNNPLHKQEIVSSMREMGFNNCRCINFIIFARLPRFLQRGVVA